MLDASQRNYKYTHGEKVENFKYPGAHISNNDFTDLEIKDITEHQKVSLLLFVLKKYHKKREESKERKKIICKTTDFNHTKQSV